MHKNRGELSEEAFGAWGFCSDQFWGCYAANILPDRCYAAGYSTVLSVYWLVLWFQDGQSEEANSIVLDLLKCYVSEHKATWEHYLPLVEYAYNNIVHTSTGKAPFEIVKGGKKVPPILRTKDKILQNTDEAYKMIKLAREKTQSKQKKAVDRHHRELVFSLGDWILLHFERPGQRKMTSKERLFSKLGMRYYGPFQVCDKISHVTYRLKLPAGWKIHNAFHVSLLRPFVGDVPEDMIPEEQPEVEELDEIPVSKQILAHKDRKVGAKLQGVIW
ncbi:hypothetical protein L7F22_044659 [Adiantum nelumboides]|nr:hypothetical protein [Adiantum nelumboides]